MSNEYILVVEDDVVTATALSRRLQAAGYRLGVAANIPQAMGALRVVAPDLMILDLTLLDDDPFGGLSDGFAFLRLLRRNCPEAEFPIIIHTADTAPSLETRAQELGAAAVIHKGRDLGELLEVIRQVLPQSPADEAAPAAAEGELVEPADSVQDELREAS